MSERTTLTSVTGLRVGHHTRSDRPTGCTVVLAPAGATAGVAVRGAAPGTRETDLLRPEATVEAVHAVVLAGGSAFGLAVADGVMAHLRDRGIGYPTPAGPVPIVPAAILYDLTVGDGDAVPDAADGAAACAAAGSDFPEEGSVGAGAGATVGKIFGRTHAMKGGVGTAGFRFEDGTVVAAQAAVNCRGDVRDPETGELVAGARTADGKGLRDSRAAILAGARTEPSFGESTVVAVVATNRRLDKAGCTRLAEIAHDGMARAVVPAHTSMDGDTVFFLATGDGEVVEGAEATDRLEVAAAESLSRAIVRGVRTATGLPGIPAVSELIRG